MASSVESFEEVNNQIPVYLFAKTNSDGLSWEGFVESIQAFVNAVEWSQPWLLAVFSFHTLTFFLLIKFRSDSNSLAIVTFSLMILASLARQLNSIAHNHWQKFSHEDYFDENGFFISMVFSFPVLVNTMIGVVFILNEVVHMLRRVKIAQMRYKRANLTDK
ncbi:transmembrane protein 18 [Gigaspora margarita]|uniref:Transmembrane protein 18 n=1 Tax=Gigaspora margarita TaxID=4874 RepID=A0A8H3XE85_GIGMA|nr:transmembrane protein 18 [Gigaspora margarita]